MHHFVQDDPHPLK
jgi:hypothetical protein